MGDEGAWLGLISAKFACSGVGPAFKALLEHLGDLEAVLRIRGGLRGLPDVLGAAAELLLAESNDASASLAYSDRLYGNDDQTVAITASDSNGAKHALSVTLQNDSTGRSQSIDQALSTMGNRAA